MATALIFGADPEGYGNMMVRGLKNVSLAGQDEWPKNVTKVYNNYLSKGEEDDIGGARPHDYEEVAFGIDGKTTKLSGPQPWHAKIACRNCNKKGHIASFLCENAKVANTNVRDGKVHKYATQGSRNGKVHKYATQQLLEAVLFVCKTEQREVQVSTCTMELMEGRC